MKKIVVLFICALFFCTASKADKKVVVTTPSTNAGHVNRTPILMPEVFIDGNTLTFDATCIGSVISLVQDGAIVYSAIIGEDCTIILPDYLSGIFELQLQRGSITFVGEIEL